MSRDKCCAMIQQPGDPTGENAQECGALADIILKDQPFCASCALPIWQEMQKDRDQEILEYIQKSLDNLASLIHAQFMIPRMAAKRLIVRANLEG